MRIIGVLYIFIIFVSCTSTYIVDNEKSWVFLGSIPYGTDVNQFIEITCPVNKKRDVNVILFIHGYRNRMVDLTLIEKYRDEFIIGNLNYRHLTPGKAELSMEELLSDVHNGLMSLKETVDKKGINVNKVIIMGHSLGGSLALMYSYTFFDKSPIPIAFCITMAGLTDLTDAMIVENIKRSGIGLTQKYLLSICSILTGTELSSDDITVLGFSDAAFLSLKNISPIQYISADASPTIIVHDTSDKIIPFSNSLSLTHVLNTHNVPSVFIQSLTNSGHYLDTNNKNTMVFTPDNVSLQGNIPKRITRKLHPFIEKRLIESINRFIIEYCQSSI